MQTFQTKNIKNLSIFFKYDNTFDITFLINLQDLNIIIPPGNWISLTENILTDINLSIRHNWVEFTILDSETWEEGSFEFKGVGIGLECIHMLLEGPVGGSLVCGGALQKFLSSKEQDFSLVDLTGDKSGSKVERVGQKVAYRYFLPDPSVNGVLFNVDLFLFWDSKTINGIIEKRTRLMGLRCMHGGNLFPLFSL